MNKVKQGTNLMKFCIPDSGTTHTILRDKTYFLELKPTKTMVNTISGPVDLIKGWGKAHFLLSNGTKVLINDALNSPQSKRNLLTFNNIYFHGYDTQAINERNEIYMRLTTYKSGKKYVVEKLPMLLTGLHYTLISPTESNMVVDNSSILINCHDRLGHPV